MSSKTIDIRIILDTSQLFGGLCAESRDRLARVARPIKLKSGKTLFNRGDPANGCYAIFDGALKVYIREEDCEETLLAVLGKGDVIGEMGLVDRLPRSATATALKDTQLGHIPMAEFEKIADSDTEIYRHLLRVLSKRIRTSNESFLVQQLPLSGRLASVLVRLSEGFGEKLPDGRILIRQKFSQADLGRMVGSARENVNRQLGEWQREELLSRISGYYCLSCLDKMRALARRQIAYEID